MLIDTGEGNSHTYIELLRQALDGARLSCIVATHWHHDHVGGIRAILDEICGSDKVKPPVYKFRRLENNGKEEWDEVEYVEHGHEITVEGASLRLDEFDNKRVFYQI